MPLPPSDDPTATERRQPQPSISVPIRVIGSPLDPSACPKREKTALTVAVVDDHHSFIDLAVRTIVAEIDGLDFVMSVPTVGELLHAAGTVDIVLLDVRLADGTTPEQNVERLRATGSRVLVLSSEEDAYLIRSIAKTEVHGIIHKTAPLAELAELLRGLLETGKGHLNRQFASDVTDAFIDQAGLSPREQEVLTRYARGQKCVSVARDLNITTDTVNDHLKSIRRKYAAIGRHAPDKISLYQRAVEDGYLPVPENVARRRGFTA